MDITLVIALAEAAGTALQANPDIVGQTYLVLNTTALIGAAFWLGAQWNTIRTNQREIAELKKKVDFTVAPLAQMKVSIDHIKEDLGKLTESMEHFRSTFMETTRLWREKSHDAEI